MPALAAIAAHRVEGHRKAGKTTRPWLSLSWMRLAGGLTIGVAKSETSHFLICHQHEHSALNNTCIDQGREVRCHGIVNSTCAVDCLQTIDKIQTIANLRRFKN